jgi:hypothetical protein
MNSKCKKSTTHSRVLIISRLVGLRAWKLYSVCSDTVVVTLGIIARLGVGWVVCGCCPSASAWRRCTSNRCYLRSVFDYLLGEVIEKFVYVDSCKRTCFKVSKSVLLAKLLSLFFRYHSIWEIYFIGNQNPGYVFTCVAVYLLEPVGDVIKSSFLSYVIHEYDSHGSLVVSLSDCAKSFLASGVPHLKFYPLVKHIDCFDFEVDPCISITNKFTYRWWACDW